MMPAATLPPDYAMLAAAIRFRRLLIAVTISDAALCQRYDVACLILLRASCYASFFAAVAAAIDAPFSAY